MLFPALLVLAVGLVYGNSFKGPFVLDDIPNLLENPHIRSPGTSWRAAFDRSMLDITLAGRPVAAATFALNWALSGEAIWSYRLVNVLIHASAALALYGILRRTLPGTGGRPDLLALLVTLVWAVHPLQVTSVTYVIQRVESLAGLMILLTLYCFIRGATGGSKLWLEMSVVACALGMAVKETAAAAPLLVLLYDRTFLAGSLGGALRRHALTYAGLAATWVVLVALVLLTPRAGLLTASDCPERWEYLRTQGWAIGHYLRLSVWPVGTVLDYGGSAVARLPAQRMAQWLPGMLLVVLLAGATVWLVIRRRPIGVAGAWFFLILAPSSSVIAIPMEAAAEHRMYLPLAAVMAVMVVALARWSPRPALPAALAVPVLASIAFGVLTVQRNRLFHDELNLWSNDVRHQPHNARSRTALGVALFERRRFADAIAQHRRALEIQPRYAEAWHNLADALFRTGRTIEAEDAYRRALELPPPSFKTHYNLAQLLMIQQRFGEAGEQYEQALRLHPGDARLWNALGYALARSGHLDRAVECFRRALQIDPGFVDAKTNLDHVRAALRASPATAPGSR